MSAECLLVVHRRFRQTLRPSERFRPRAKPTVRGIPVGSPPVEELLLARAYLALKRPDDAKHIYQAAVDWLDRPDLPLRAAGIVALTATNPWCGVVATAAPVEDERRNPFDWESWHETDVFRAEAERLLAGHPSLRWALRPRADPTGRHFADVWRPSSLSGTGRGHTGQAEVNVCTLAVLVPNKIRHP